MRLLAWLCWTRATTSSALSSSTDRTTILGLRSGEAPAARGALRSGVPVTSRPTGRSRRRPLGRQHPARAPPAVPVIMALHSHCMGQGSRSHNRRFLHHQTFVAMGSPGCSSEASVVPVVTLRGPRSALGRQDDSTRWRRSAPHSTTTAASRSSSGRWLMRSRRGTAAGQPGAQMVRLPSLATWTRKSHASLPDIWLTMKPEPRSSYPKSAA